MEIKFDLLISHTFEYTVLTYLQPGAIVKFVIFTILFKIPSKLVS